MNIRWALPEDTQEVKNLWDYCFDDSEDFIQWYFTDRYNYNNTLVVDKEGIVSALQIIPYNLQVRQSIQKTGYIIGVSSSPAVRGEGYISDMIKVSLEKMREREQYLSILMPFMFSFYTNFGWGLCYHHLKHDVEINKLKPLSTKWGNYRPFKYQRDISYIKKIYGEFTKDKSGYVLREDKEWYDICQDIDTDKGFIYLLLDDREEAMGYIIYYLREDYIIVKEMAYLDSLSKASLFNFIYNHRSHINKVQLILPYEDLTHLQIPDLKQNVNISPFMMARIVDVDKLLSSLAYSRDVQEHLTIKLEDTIAPWNEKPFSLRVKGGRGQYQTIDEEQWDLQCSINTFTQIVMGAFDMDVYFNLGLLKIRDNDKGIINKLNAIFPRQNNFINEYI